MKTSRALNLAIVATAAIATMATTASAKDIRLAQTSGSERVPGGVEHRPSDGGTMAPGSATDGATSRSVPRRAVAPPTLGATGGAATPAAPAAPADAKKAQKEDAPKK